jgi:hypothetical protein
LTTPLDPSEMIRPTKTLTPLKASVPLPGLDRYLPTRPVRLL